MLPEGLTVVFHMGRSGQAAGSALGRRASCVRTFHLSNLSPVFSGRVCVGFTSAFRVGMLIARVRRNGSTAGSNNVWLAMLVAGCQLLLRPPTTGQQETFAVVGQIHNCIVVAWPMEPHPQESRLFTFRKLESFASLRLLVLDTLEGWTGSPLRWYSPASCISNEVDVVGIVAFAVRWGTLLSACAMQAYGALSWHQLGVLVGFAFTISDLF